MIRIMTATEPKLITITVDGELSGEYVDAVETCVRQAIAQRRSSASFCATFPPSTRADALFWAAWRRRVFACVPQEFTLPTSLQKSTSPLRRQERPMLPARRTPIRDCRVCEDKTPARCRRPVASLASAGVVGPAESVTSAGRKHALTMFESENTQMWVVWSLGGLVGICLVLSFFEKAPGSSKQIKEEVLTWGAPLLFISDRVGGRSRIASADGEALFRDCEFKAAAHAFEQALTNEPGNARLHFWLGKSYARMAEVSSLLSARRNARKAQAHLETAAQLDPGNREFWKELFEFYVDSPEYFDGGLNRAMAVLERLGPDDGGPGTPSRIVADRERSTAARDGL